MTSTKTWLGDNFAGGGDALLLSFMLASIPPPVAENCHAFIVAGVLDPIATAIIAIQTDEISGVGQVHIGRQYSSTDAEVWRLIND